MFEGMSDDEEDFQSVSHGAWSLRRSAWVTQRRWGGELKVFFLNVWLFVNRGAQRDPPAEREAQRACVPYRWATAGRRGLGQSRRASWRRLWLSPAPLTAAQSRQQPPARWESSSVTDRRQEHICAAAFVSAEPCCSSFSSPLIQGDSSNNVAPMPAGTPVSNDLFSQALQQALQASNMSTLQVRTRLNPQNSIHRGTSNLLLGFFQYQWKI